MKHTVKSALMAFACLSFIGLANAEDTKTEDHSVHHTEGQVKETKTDEKNEMGKMDMPTKMGKCMKMHKDGKMCDHEMKGKCPKKMHKGDCMKEMKDTEVENKNESK